MAPDPLQMAPKGFPLLLESLGWSDPDLWWSHWQQRGGFQLARCVWPAEVNDEWLLGVALPLLSQAESLLNIGGRPLLGLSALPGCGKTTLCDWLVQASSELGWSIAFLSIDDFYWPGPELDRRMAGNPWGVPRAIPGSHDLELMATALDQWRETGVLYAPRFDKSLRQGRGDRSEWVRSTPDLVVLEGWFVGVLVPDQVPAEQISSLENSHSLELTREELVYREQLIRLVPDYAPLWHRIDKLWHLKAQSGTSSRLWKRQQVDTQTKTTGVVVPQSALQNFVRMIETAFPVSWLQDLHLSNVVIDLTNQRAVREITLK
ncbi:kinase [Synechococcus sp. CC9311]|uniref:kinase n=1 Tax=Synechococcus sp. (strain CC9311) TaxID=64471 RepID=UPI00032155A9|nr:kinase [Synechococcus sp. CC9311]